VAFIIDQRSRRNGFSDLPTASAGNRSICGESSRGSSRGSSRDATSRGVGGDGRGEATVHPGVLEDSDAEPDGTLEDSGAASVRSGEVSRAIHQAPPMRLIQMTKSATGRTGTEPTLNSTRSRLRNGSWKSTTPVRKRRICRCRCVVGSVVIGDGMLSAVPVESPATGASRGNRYAASTGPSALWMSRQMPGILGSSSE